jgi:hypothetical protein
MFIQKISSEPLLPLPLQTDHGLSLLKKVFDMVLEIVLEI